MAALKTKPIVAPDKAEMPTLVVNPRSPASFSGMHVRVPVVPGPIAIVYEPLHESFMAVAEMRPPLMTNIYVSPGPSLTTLHTPANASPDGFTEESRQGSAAASLASETASGELEEVSAPLSTGAPLSDASLAIREAAPVAAMASGGTLLSAGPPIAPRLGIPGSSAPLQPTQLPKITAGSSRVRFRVTGIYSETRAIRSQKRALPGFGWRSWTRPLASPHKLADV
jgi:hypothetical protein